jgi:hypothetical protein
MAIRCLSMSRMGMQCFNAPMRTGIADGIVTHRNHIHETGCAEVHLLVPLHGNIATLSHWYKPLSISA